MEDHDTYSQALCRRHARYVGGTRARADSERIKRDLLARNHALGTKL